MILARLSSPGSPKFATTHRRRCWESLATDRMMLNRCDRIKRILLIYIKLIGVISCTIVLNIFQILTIPLIPFAHYWVMDVTSFMAGTAWRLMDEAFEELANGRIVLSGDEDIPEGESALIISNHVSFVDVFLIHALALRKKMLSHCRYFAKVHACEQRILHRNRCSIFRFLDGEFT